MHRTVLNPSCVDDLPPAAGYLLDLDGTLVQGGRALPWARPLLRGIEGRFAILSNDAEHTPQALSRQLDRLGLSVPPDRIILAGTAAVAEVARRHPGARVMLLGSAALRRVARAAGLRLALRGVEVVLLARDRRFDHAALAAAANALRGGAALVVANPDLTHPGPNGAIVPETGALLAALLACAGDVPHIVVGKPEPTLFRQALALLDTAPEATVMIGDNAATDGQGAARLGLRFWPVGNAALVPATA
jgi:HAD superfamily hydrolase (TIGR01450 family)